MPTQDTIALELEERKITGKAVKKIRAEGKVPAVIHDHGKESIVVMGPYLAIYKAYQKAGKHNTVELHVGKKEYTAIIKTVDFDPRRNELQHIVFNAVAADQKIEAEIPVHIVGEIPATKAGLMVITQLDHVEVEALPKDLPSEFTADGGKLVELGDRITVADLEIPPSVVLLTEPEHPIATVEETKAQMSEEEAEEPEEGAEEEGGEESAETSESESSSDEEK